jgi:hypothetical protein
VTTWQLENSRANDTCVAAVGGAEAAGVLSPNKSISGAGAFGFEGAASGGITSPQQRILIAVKVPTHKENDSQVIE